MACNTTTSMYLNKSTTICASATATRTDANTISVSGTFEITQSLNTGYNTNAIYARVDNHTSYTRVKPAGSSLHNTRNFSFTQNVGTGSGSVTYTARFQVYNDAESGGIGNSATVNFTVTYPAGGSAPATPTVSASATSASVINVSWGTSDLGNPTGTVTLYYGTTNNPTTYLHSKTTTGINIFGHDQRTANTRYYYKATAANTIGSADSSVVSAVTYPAGITSTATDTTTETSARIKVVCAASGSALTTTLQSSTNNTNWTDMATNVQGTTVYLDYTGLTPNTTYTRYLRIHTTAGNSATVTIYFTTLKRAHLYGSVNNQTKLVRKLYGSVNSRSKKILKVYGSVNGVTKLIYRDQ